MFITRRSFLKAAAGASSLVAFSPAVPGFLCHSAETAARAKRRETALVVIQLSGGNDGLNTVVPYEDDAYHRNRPTLALKANQVCKIGNQLGFHSDMPAFQRLFADGLLSVVQGVGYPSSNRNHDGAMRDWHTATPKQSETQSGWIGRALDLAWNPPAADLPGVFVGHIEPPLSVRAEKVFVPAIRSLDQWAIGPGGGATEDGGASAGVLPEKHPDNSLLQFAQAATAGAQTASQRVLASARAAGLSGKGAYPQYRLAQTLQTISRLIRAELGIRIYFAELGGGGIGGFDTHAGQAANHGALLRELAESVAAFVNDLRQDKLLDRVTVMTFSEFGRTLSENGRRGTGHGAAAPMFVAGGALKGGLVGEHPSLKLLDADAPRHHTDFRSVYATILDQWLGFESRAILGGSFPPVNGIFA